MLHEHAELLLRLIIQHTFDEIFITDHLGNVLAVSPSCSDLYGIEAKEMLEQNVFALEEAGVLCPSVTALVLKSRERETLVQQTRTGRTVVVSAFPIFDEQGQLLGTLSFSRDITELEQLKKRNDQVAKTILMYQKEIAELKSKNVQGLYLSNGKMKKVLDLVAKVADLDVTLLLEGESGVGKNRLAHMIHEISERRGEPFIEVNCGAIPESLIESELFGYEEGSFTGAKKGGRIGYFEAAGRGTLFLDEIAELPLNLQVKLLSVLQNQTVTRLGGNTRIRLNCRIICATNQNLEQLVKERKFREDLYYRINVIKIVIPPLRERREEIVSLIYEITEEFNAKYKLSKQFAPSFVAWLIQQEWPGNVRELRNFIEKAMITSNGPFIDLNQELIEEKHVMHEGEALGFDRYMEAVEKEFITWMYHKYPSSVMLARQLGISQSTANRKINKYVKNRLVKND
ncbi:sigma-54 interaction domain-containing protein [Brevibacillus massiliensis]|uniref:sigma-54 interaction domain-containing protein n=1 Tax=Brevibacillus massiliensis TaxID=1118054 RepID=UPI0002F88707|nr:sigma 54-interacting transcriptional regulator [Brevibacillus massiliensis]